MNEPARHIYEFGPFRLDTAAGLLLRDAVAVPLTPHAYEMLRLLVSNPGRLVNKEEMMQTVWPNTFVEENNLAVNIMTIRKALGEGRDETHYIENVPRRGYRFVAAVRDATAEPQMFRTENHVATPAPARDSRAEWQPVGGALALDSEVYLARPADEKFRAAIARRDSIVLVKGPRQVGKTSLLARGLEEARGAGAKIILSDFQNLNAAYLESIEKLFLMLAESIADQLDLAAPPAPQ